MNQSQTRSGKYFKMIKRERGNVIHAILHGRY